MSNTPTPPIRIEPLRRSFAIALSVCALQACGNAPPSGGVSAQVKAEVQSPAATTEPSSPLTPNDIDYYAGVMSAAVERLEHPTSDDQAVLAQAKKVENGSAGTDPNALARAATVMERAVELQSHVDDEIVRTRHLDADRYARIRDRIEAVISPVEAGADGGDASDATPEAIAPVEARRRELAQQQFTSDSTALAPRKAELQRLIRRVRIPALANSGE